MVSGSCVGHMATSDLDARSMIVDSFMATRASSELSSFSITLYIRGYHAYKEVWSPFTGEVLPLEREPDNPEDIHAVAIKKTGEVVGDVPFNLAPTVSAFLRRSTNKCLQK